MWWALLACDPAPPPDAGGAPPILVPSAPSWAGDANHAGASVAVLADGRMAIGAPSTGYTFETGAGPAAVYLLSLPASAATLEEEADAVLRADPDASYGSVWWALFGAGLVDAGDLDGDGERDLVVLDDPERHGTIDAPGIWVFSGPLAAGEQQAGSPGSFSLDWDPPWHGSACELDGDGLADLCLGAGAARGPIGPGAAPTTTWTGADGPTIAADLDGDGVDGLLLAGGGALWWAPDLPQGDHEVTALASTSFDPPSATGRIDALEVADLDGDGAEDVAVAWTDGAVGSVYLLVGAAGGPMASGLATLPGPAQAVAVADLDGDGAADVCVGEGTEVAVTSAPRGVEPVPLAIYVHALGEGQAFGFALDAGDLDGDSLADLVIGSPDESVTYGYTWWHGAVYLVLGSDLP